MLNVVLAQWTYQTDRVDADKALHHLPDTTLGASLQRCLHAPVEIGCVIAFYHLYASVRKHTDIPSCKNGTRYYA